MELEVLCFGFLALQRFILLLGKNSPLILVFFIIWKILKTFIVLQVVSQWLRSSLRCLLDPRKWFSKMELVQQKSETSPQEMKTIGRGTTGDAAHRTPYQCLCQLHCTELACQVCRRVAQEAWQLIYWQRADGRSAKSRFLLSPWPCQETKVSTITSVEEEQESCIWTSSVTSSSVGTVSVGPESTTSTETSQHVSSIHGQKASKPATPEDRKTRGSFSRQLDVYTEDSSSWSSSTYETSSITSWTDSSSHSTTIFSSLKSHWSRKHHKRLLHKQKSSRGSPKQASSEATKVEEMPFLSVPASFMKQALIQSLESHWVAKRLQHLLGMSWVLLKSLSSFMPSAPNSSSVRPLRFMVVVRRPQVLAFVTAKTKKYLELHLKKRVHLKHWQLPRRVQGALRYMKPPLPLLPKSENSLVQKLSRTAKRSGVTSPPLLPRSLAIIQMKVKLHLAKKCVEIQAEVFPEVVLHAWQRSMWLAKQPLPKLVSHADKPLEARLVFLPFVLPQDVKKMELAVQRCCLSSCWDLGKWSTESLVAVGPPPSSSKPLLGRRAASKFSGAQTPFLQQRGRETLEAHVRKKELQHKWGLPSLVQRSLNAFLPSVVPRGSVPRKAESHFEALPQKLDFLPRDTCILLEFHLQRMKLQQKWSLPRRVLETYRRLIPELPCKEKRGAVKPFSQQPRLGIRPPPGGLTQEEEKARKIQGLQLCPAQPLLVLKAKVLTKLQVHLTKKHLEVCLQSFPAVPQISWRSSRWSQERPLPKLILPGLTTPQTRIPCSSCGLAATGRIESALKRGQLASLWGLSLKYVEVVTEMATIVQQDAERPRPPDETKELDFRSAERKTLFFQPSAREVLEMHIKKKRIQHQWDLPSLVQRSLQSFSGRMSPLHPSKAVTQTSILPREVLFLPWKVTNFLELHLQRMKLQQRWGLPRRVLESCRRLFSGLFHKEKAMPLAKQSSRKPGLGISPVWAGGLVKLLPDVQKTPGVGLHPAQSLRRLSLPALMKLENHLTKKHLEVCLETFPAVPCFSWQSVWLSTSRSLPKWILPGLKTPQPRRPCLSLDLAAMGRIEVALQRGHLVSLWGLGLKYVETLAALSPKGTSAKFKEVPFEFSEVKFPFFKNVVKENLEMHVRKKRLQHEWGYSTLVQRSLRSLIGEAPQRPRGLLKAVTQTSLLRLELLFLSEPVKQNLELHIQRMKMQQRWGLPQKVHQSVKFFHSPLPEEKPQAKFGLGETQTDSARWEETKVLLPKNKGCLEDLLRYTLETHLKKKSLEIKFQLIGYQMFSGPIKRVFLPKLSSMSSEIKPRTSCLYFMEQEIVGKINLNIKCKHLMHLWGLPSIYTKSLSKMFGNVITGSLPLEMSKLRWWTLEKNIGRESQTADAMGSRTKELRWSSKSPCFVQTEIRDLLEMHVRRKKLQHEWGLPSMIQKSLRGFAALSLEPERLLEGLGIATTGSWGALKRTIKITKSYFYLDPVTQKLLEAHMKTRTAIHRWGLPKRVQESLKMFLSPASPSQVESDLGQAGTSRHAYNRLFQTAAKQRHKAECIHRVITVKRSLPKAELLGKMSQRKILRSGRETQKMTPGKETVPMFLKLEDLEFMGLHIRHKRIHHEWGLPTLVQKSLQAFAPVPPEPQKKSLTGLARERFQDGRKARRVVHVPQSMIRVLVPHPYFLSQHAKDLLEYHVSCQTKQHKWGLPRVIQDALRAMIPPPQVPHEKARLERHLGFHLQEGVHASHSRKEGPPWWTSSWKDATIKPMKNIHQRKPDAKLPQDASPTPQILAPLQKAKHHLGATEIPRGALQGKTGGTIETMRFLCPKRMLSFLPVEKRHLLEFHVQQKKIQHAWGLPWMVLRSLHVFAPYLPQPERTTGKTTSRKPRRESKDVQILTQDLNFLSFEVKGRLEAHLRHRTSKHRWGLPERVQQSLRAFLPPTSSSRPGMTGFRPLVPLQPKSLQITEDIYEPVMFKPKPKHKTLEKQNVETKRQRAKGRSKKLRQTKAQACSGTKTGLSFLPEGSQNLLEFHILWKRIQHAWGLPSMVLQSLQAFAPRLLKAEKGTTGMVAKIPLCDGEVQILSQDLNFLSVEEKELLEAHLRHLVSEHRWGLPERVQRPLRAFLPPRSPSHSEVTGSLPVLPYPPTATYVQPPSWTSKGTEDLQILPCSSPSYIDYRSNVGKPERKVSFPKVNLGSGRTMPRVKNEMPLLGFEAKMDSWQKEDGSQRTTKRRGSLEGLTATPKTSTASRELKKSPKIPICLSCHSSAPPKTSISLSKSDRQPKWPEKKKKKKNQVQWEMGKGVADDSSLLSEDNEAQDSPWSSGNNMEGSEESSGDDMSRSSVQEPEATKVYGRPYEVQLYHTPISQQDSYFFPHHVHVPNSSYEDVVSRHYRQLRREHQATQSSRLQWRGSRLTWREFLGHALGEAGRCQTFCRTQRMEQWSSECERFLCLQHPSFFRGNRSSTEGQVVQLPKESRKGTLQYQDFVRTDVELQVHQESCSLTLKTDSKEEGRMERVTFSIAKERNLLSLETRSQGSVWVDDWDQGRKLEVKWEDQNKGTEESLREEMGSWTWANSSGVRHPPNLAELTALSLVAPSEESNDQVSSTVAEATVGSPKDHGVPKPGEISDCKDQVTWLKRKTPIDLRQAEAMGQDSGAQRPHPRGKRSISCSPGKPPETRKKKQVKVNWSSKETHKELLVVRRLDPKLSQALEVPRQGVHKRPQEQRSPASEKMAILGNILEKKLNLQEGLFIWRQSLRRKEGRGRKRDKREGRDGGRQGGRLPQPSSPSVDKQSFALSTIL